MMPSMSAFPPGGTLIVGGGVSSGRQTIVRLELLMTLPGTFASPRTPSKTEVGSLGHWLGSGDIDCSPSTTSRRPPPLEDVWMPVQSNI